MTKDTKTTELQDAELDSANGGYSEVEWTYLKGKGRKRKIITGAGPGGGAHVTGPLEGG